MLDNGVFKLNTNEVYRVTYGDDEYEVSKVITFTYMEYNASITTKVTTTSTYTPYLRMISKKIVNDSSVEDDVAVNENTDVIEEDVESLSCGAK